MDYIKPTEVVKTMLAAGNTKAGLPVKDLLIRGVLSGARTFTSAVTRAGWRRTWMARCGKSHNG